MNWLLAIIFLLIVGNCIRVAVCVNRTNRFREKVTIGSVCSFYVMETRRPGMVKAIALDNETCAVKDEYDNIHLISINDLYPL